MWQKRREIQRKCKWKRKKSFSSKHVKKLMESLLSTLVKVVVMCLLKSTFIYREQTFIKIFSDNVVGGGNVTFQTLIMKLCKMSYILGCYFLLLLYWHDIIVAVVVVIVRFKEIYVKWSEFNFKYCFEKMIHLKVGNKFLFIFLHKM